MAGVRSHWWETALLAAAVAYSVGSALLRPVMVVEGGVELATRLDLAVAFMPQGWPTLAALLWAPLVVFRDREAVDRVGATIWSGALLLIVAVLVGIGVGCFGAVAAGRAIVIGRPESLVALLASMLVLYLTAAALIVATGRFWIPAVLAGACLAAIRTWAVASGWPPIVAVQEWIALGALGPGVLMESPGIAAGVILEHEWEDLRPWPAVLLWLLAAAATTVLAVRTKGDRW